MFHFDMTGESVLGGEVKVTDFALDPYLGYNVGVLVRRVPVELGRVTVSTVRVRFQYSNCS
jgi:hypothetical protein